MVETFATCPTALVHSRHPVGLGATCRGEGTAQECRYQPPLWGPTSDNLGVEGDLRRLWLSRPSWYGYGRWHSHLVPPSLHSAVSLASETMADLLLWLYCKLRKRTWPCTASLYPGASLTLAYVSLFLWSHAEISFKGEDHEGPRPRTHRSPSGKLCCWGSDTGQNTLPWGGSSLEPASCSVVTVWAECSSGPCHNNGTMWTFHCHEGTLHFRKRVGGWGSPRKEQVPPGVGGEEPHNAARPETRLHSASQGVGQTLSVTPLSKKPP